MRHPTYGFQGRWLLHIQGPAYSWQLKTMLSCAERIELMYAIERISKSAPSCRVFGSDLPFASDASSRRRPGRVIKECMQDDPASGLHANSHVVCATLVMKEVACLKVKWKKGKALPSQWSRPRAWKSSSVSVPESAPPSSLLTVWNHRDRYRI